MGGASLQFGNNLSLNNASKLSDFSIWSGSQLISRIQLNRVRVCVYLMPYATRKKKTFVSDSFSSIKPQEQVKTYVIHRYKKCSLYITTKHICFSATISAYFFPFDVVHSLVPTLNYLSEILPRLPDEKLWLGSQGSSFIFWLPLFFFSFFIYLNILCLWGTAYQSTVNTPTRYFPKAAGEFRCFYWSYAYRILFVHLTDAKNLQKQHTEIRHYENKGKTKEGSL